MISWIQRRFKKHTTVVLAFLLVLVAIPFVFSINGGIANWGLGDRGAKKREFFGHNITSQVEMRRLTDDARVSIMLRVGSMMPVKGAQLETYAYQRTAALALADRFHMPSPTSAEVRSYLTTLRLFQDEHGAFDPARYGRFRAEIAEGGEITEGNVAKVLAEELRIQRTERLLSGPGYVAPIEVNKAFAFSSTQWVLQVVAYDLTGFAAPAAPSEEVLAKYFAAHLARFEIPERVWADYVRFSAADFVSEEPSSEGEVLEYYEANRQRFEPSSDSLAGMGSVHGLAAVRRQVETALRTERAGQRSAGAAAEFAAELFEKRISKDSPAMDALIAKHKGRRTDAPLLTVKRCRRATDGRVRSSIVHSDSMRRGTSRMPSPLGPTISCCCGAKRYRRLVQVWTR